MNINHVWAVFKAEYYTTTSKFRSSRKYIPLLFILGVIVFSYILRLIYQLFRGDQIFDNPPITTFFSIIAVFSYFILFTPLLSPLGRLVYDGSARSRREVALNSPVQSKDLLYGNLLSNLAFFLPFFGFIGTLTLSPFIGNGIFSPLITSLLLFFVLSTLIIVGLVGGTLISPLIFAFISSRKNSQTRAIVSFSVSAMLIISLPIFRYFLENTSIEGNLGWISYLPFTLASILIVYILYGVSISIPVLHATFYLIIYIFILLLIGYLTADKIYNLDNDENDLATSNPNGIPEKTLSKVTFLIPKTYRTVVEATMKSSLRDIEHLARLTIGLSITVFMIFALSSRGVFRSTVNFDARIELSVIIFALILSSASVIMIEASSFTIQHREMFSLIKSAPLGARKFVVGKVLQMVLLLTPIFATIIISLSFLDFIDKSNILPLLITVIITLITMTTLSLAIYLVNPSDNEEDLSNILNLLLFYLISFVIASIPVYVIFAGIEILNYQFMLLIICVLILSYIFLIIAITALEYMNLETLDSDFSRSILQAFKTFGIFLLGWNLMPLLGLSYFVRTFDIVGFLFLNYSLILLFVVGYYTITHSKHQLTKLSLKNLIETAKAILIMLMIGFTIGLILPSTGSNIIFNLDLLNIDKKTIFTIIFALAIIEELFFRGMLLEYSAREMTKNKAMIVNAIIFGIIHFYPFSSFVNAILQSLILVRLKYKTNSVLFPVIAHITYNIILITILTIFN